MVGVDDDHRQRHVVVEDGCQRFLEVCAAAALEPDPTDILGFLVVTSRLYLEIQPERLVYFFVSIGGDFYLEGRLGSRGRILLLVEFDVDPPAEGADRVGAGVAVYRRYRAPVRVPNGQLRVEDVPEITDVLGAGRVIEGGGAPGGVGCPVDVELERVRRRVAVHLDLVLERRLLVPCVVGVDRAFRHSAGAGDGHLGVGGLGGGEVGDESEDGDGDEREGKGHCQRTTAFAVRRADEPVQLVICATRDAATHRCA